MILFIIYIIVTLLQMWFFRNSTINWYNKKITYTKWEYTNTYTVMPLGYFLCVVPFATLLLNDSEYWTLRYVKPKNIKR